MDEIAWHLHMSEKFLSGMKNLKQTKKKEKIPRTDFDHTLINVEKLKKGRWFLHNILIDLS